jgi:hypothetical protein
MEGAVILTLVGSTGDQARIYASDGEVSTEELAAGDLARQQRAIIEYVQNTLTQPGKRHVLLKAERGVKHREVARVARAVAQATEAPLYIAVLEER